MDTGKYVQIREGLRKKAVLEDNLPEEIKTIAGVDQSFPRRDRVRSCVVVLGFPELEEKEKASAEVAEDFPYIPGLLAFREAPSIIEAYEKLRKKPDVLMVDGHGIAHPKRMGIATHVGVLLDTPTIGVAKKKLVGEYTPPEEEGDFSILRDSEEILGFAYKSRKGCKPIFISPGHMISLYTSMLLVEKCLRGYRLPEPTRIAHMCVNEI